VLLVLLLASIFSKKRRIDLVQRFCKKLGFGSCGSKFKENRPLFIGLLVPCRREEGVLPDLSIRGLQIATYSEK
jgi:hypothetical protein